MTKAVRRYMASLGRRGGSSRSERKRAAGRINVAKALAARLSKAKPSESLDI